MNQEILQAYLRQEETPAYIFDLDMLKSSVPQENFTFVRQSEFQWRALYCPV